MKSWKKFTTACTGLISRMSPSSRFKKNLPSKKSETLPRMKVKNRRKKHLRMVQSTSQRQAASPPSPTSSVSKDPVGLQRGQALKVEGLVTGMDTTGAVKKLQVSVGNRSFNIPVSEAIAWQLFGHREVDILVVPKDKKSV